MKIKLLKLQLILALVLILISVLASQAQTLDYESKVTVHLKDGTSVDLYGKVSNSDLKKGRFFLGSKNSLKVPNAEYYYVPPANSLRLSKKPDGTPEFLFMKFTSDKRADQGGVENGAIMHFLMEWGLTEAQEKEVEEKLKEKVSNGKIMGCVQVMPDISSEGGTFDIISATLSDKSFTKALVSGKAPLIEGGKTAVAARLDKYGAQLLGATFEKTSSITDLSIQLNYTFPVQIQAAQGSMSFNQGRYHKVVDSLKAEYKYDRSKFLWWEWNQKRSYSEMRKVYDKMWEYKVVSCKFVEGPHVPEEKMQIVRQAFFDFFLNNFTKTTKVPEEAEDREVKTPDIKKGRRYKYEMVYEKVSNYNSSSSFSLDWRMSINMPFQITGNLSSWYDGVRDNEKCVGMVSLDDPAFEHRDIRVILDVDTRDLFDTEVNHATVTIKKDRNDGHDFFETVVFDSENIKKEGVVRALTYSRRGDNNVERYKYKTQWSLKNGFEIADEEWREGDWSGLTLAPTVVPRTIELEADLEELEASRISRVTAQIKYLKFGEEETRNIDISPAKKETLASSTIFVDKDAKGYVYRLIVNHKDDGKLVFPWKEKIDDDYLYAVIPEEVEDKASRFFNDAKERAKESGGLIKEVLNEVGGLKEELKSVFKGK